MTKKRLYSSFDALEIQGCHAGGEARRNIQLNSGFEETQRLPGLVLVLLNLCLGAYSHSWACL